MSDVSSTLSDPSKSFKSNIIELETVESRACLLDDCLGSIKLSLSIEFDSDSLDCLVILGGIVFETTARDVLIRAVGDG